MPCAIALASISILWVWKVLPERLGTFYYMETTLSEREVYASGEGRLALGDIIPSIAGSGHRT